jgi:hypothetical protein
VVKVSGGAGTILVLPLFRVRVMVGEAEKLFPPSMLYSTVRSALWVADPATYLVPAGISP